MTSAHRVPPGSIVTAALDGVAGPCLKVERPARDYVNHYLVPLTGERRRLALVYIDPELPLEVLTGAALELGDHGVGFPDVGDVFRTPKGDFLKVRDEPRAQKVFAYIDLATGLVRPRMDRHAEGVAGWRVSDPRPE
jgi:hypothetical protein